MKKLLCIVCLLATVLFVDTASACMNGRCGGSFGRPSYGRAPVMRPARPAMRAPAMRAPAMRPARPAMRAPAMRAPAMRGGRGYRW